MTKTQIISWARQIGHILNTARQLEENLDQLKANEHVANAVENTKHIATVQVELDRIGRDYDKVLTELCNRANVRDADEAEKLLTDIQARLELAENAFTLWRKRLAQHELMAATGGFVEEGQEGFTRKQVEEVIASTENQYNQAVELASNLIPNKAVLIA